MNEVFLYDRPIIPEGFKFPEEYIRIAKIFPDIDIRDWRLLFDDMGTSLRYYSSMLSDYKDKPLIPFAILPDELGREWSGFPIVACFDGDDRSGDPIVYLHDFNKGRYPSWNKLFYLTNFSEWLERAKKEDAKKFRLDRLNDD